jgi:tRNA pseudouridine13 synthase
MKLKQIPEDFQVEEIYDLDKLKEKDLEKENLNFYYFKLTKKDYTLNRVIEFICKIFKVQIRDIHFSGTKDRNAITTQIISIKKLRKNWEEDVKYFNEKFEDLNLEFLGLFPSRLNLGDNLGNKFMITVRDLTDLEIKKTKEEFKSLKEKGVLNYFDSQRFGYAQNNHLVGIHLIKKEFDKAFFEIILSCPPDPKPEMIEFINYIKKNINNLDLNKAIFICPDWLRNEKKMIEYIAKYKNDYLGAISLLPKKLRTMFINAYQSYLFNEMIFQLNHRGKLDNYSELPLISFDSQLDNGWGEIILKILKKDEISLEDFRMSSSPTLQPKEVMRKVRIPIKNFQISEENKDELNKGKKKMILDFMLEKGAYATNVIKCLFQDN